MDKNNKAILLGISFGDGYINTSGKYKSELRVVHSSKQYEYLLHKANLIKRILGGNFNIKKYIHSPPSFNGKSYEVCGFTSSHRYWSILKEEIYINNNKVITESLLKQFTPQSFALLYMDDGHLRRHISNGKISSCTCDIALMTKKSEVECFIDFFNSEYGIKWNLRYDKRCNENKAWFVQSNTKEAKKFGELIKPYIIPSMSYKILHVIEPTSAEHPYQGDDIVRTIMNNEMIDNRDKEPY